MKPIISYEDGVYVFEYKDEYGFVVTDGATIEILRKNIKEAMELHFQGVKKLKHSSVIDASQRNFEMPLHLSFSPTGYAFDLQRN